MDNVEENNKLIAEFMELHVFRDRSYGMSPLQYHESWDWLMPAVKKIADSNNSIEIAHRIGYGESVYSCSILSANNVCSILSMEKDLLKATYKAIVEFIKWYKIHCARCGEMTHHCLCSHED